MKVNTKYILKRQRPTANYEPVVFEKGNLFWGDEKKTFVKFIPDLKGEFQLPKGVETLTPDVAKDYKVTDYPVTEE